MARVVIIGASIGGLPAAYEARELLDQKHKVTVISNVESFHFVPSNPWVAVGWRKRKDISFALGPVLEKKGIEFVHATADRIEPEQNRVVTAKGEEIDRIVAAMAELDAGIFQVGPDIASGDRHRIFLDRLRRVALQYKRPIMFGVLATKQGDELQGLGAVRPMPPP